MEIPANIHSSWHEHLQPLFDDPKMDLLKNDVIPARPFYPSSENIFRVFSMPLKDIKVVIVGQDPYPNGEAIGLSFAVDKDSAKPASLKIIEQEVARTHSYTSEWKLDRTLSHWVEQGVFLLNAALTVERKAKGSHMKYWEWFTREVVIIISREVTPIWLLWGTQAQGFDFAIRNAEVFKVNHILKAPHPAAELYGNKEKFTGCGHFTATNKILHEGGDSLINW